jgi:hypothetical protein
MGSISNRVAKEHGQDDHGEKMVEGIQRQPSLIEVVDKQSELFVLWSKHTDDINVTNLSEALALAVDGDLDEITIMAWMLATWLQKFAKEIRETMA